jgi:hypothetical protein
MNQGLLRQPFFNFEFQVSSFACPGQAGGTLLGKLLAQSFFATLSFQVFSIEPSL